MVHIKTKLIFSALVVNCLALQAQKLPKTQQAGIYAIRPITIDGKALELNNTFQAFNPATDCFYTLSNDNVNLYLSVQARLGEIVNKVILGGISFSIREKGDKKTAGDLKVTFPIMSGESRAGVANFLARKVNQKRDSALKTIYVKDLNSMFQSAARNIGLKTATSQNVESISIYNDQGIKAAAQIDSQLYYTYELSIPLDSIRNYIAANGVLSYSIKINAPDDKPQGTRSGAPPPPVMIATMSDTDFWAQYTIVSKR
ncbi:MAG: hypothetical protein V4687_00605 [Bacteroidota bacterium]